MVLCSIAHDINCALDSDHKFLEEQETYLLAVCQRTMSLPVGRSVL